MHACALVVLPPGNDDIVEAVGRVLAPYDESLEVEQITEDGETYWHNPRSFWDWWQIGGRFTGLLDGYNPSDDPTLRETCHLCKGTGTRTDMVVKDGCNGCTGTGMMPLWPTQWPQREGDVGTPAQAIAKASEEHLCYTIIAGETVLHREGRNPDWEREEGYDNYFLDTPDFDAKVIALLRAAPPDSRVVVVDYHS